MSKKLFAKIAIVLTALIIGFFYQTNKIKNNESYITAYSFILGNKKISDKSGKILSIEYYPFGHRMIDRGSSGYAEYRFDLESENGSSEIYCELNKRLGAWEVSNATMVLSNTRERIKIK